MYSPKQFYVYILTNKWQTALYVGVTSDVMRRLHEHRTKVFPTSFSARYRVDKLVYVEQYDNPMTAIEREKQIKAGSRLNKDELIYSINPEWKDLSEAGPCVNWQGPLISKSLPARRGEETFQT